MKKIVSFGIQMSADPRDSSTYLSLHPRRELTVRVSRQGCAFGKHKRRDQYHSFDLSPGLRAQTSDRIESWDRGIRMEDWNDVARASFLGSVFYRDLDGRHI